MKEKQCCKQGLLCVEKAALATVRSLFSLIPLTSPSRILCSQVEKIQFKLLPFGGGKCANVDAAAQHLCMSDILHHAEIYCIPCCFLGFVVASHCFVYTSISQGVSSLY